MSSDIERLQKAAGSDPAALIRLADSLVAQGRAEEAVSECRRGLAKRPDDVPLRLALGRALSAAGHLEEAQAALLDAVSRQQVRPQKARDPDPPTPVTSQWDPNGPPSDSQEIESDVESDIEYHQDVSDRHVVGEEFAEPQPETRPAHRAAVVAREPMAPSGPIDLDRVAEQLLDGSSGGGALSVEEAPPAPPDEGMLAWAAKRSRGFVWMWVGFTIIVAGIAGGWIWRVAQKNKMLAATVEKADGRLLEATFEGDEAARELFASAVRVDPKTRKYFAMVAYAAARLHADQGSDSDATAWAMMKRSEKEEKKHKQDPDPRVDRELRQARALLALARGEPCTPTVDAEDGDISARCSVQKGDVDAARRQLAATVANGGDAKNLRALLVLGSLELGAGDLDASDGAFRKVLQVSKEHPRALVGRALVALERGETPSLAGPFTSPEQQKAALAAGTPYVKVGPTVEAWYHLAQGLTMLGRGKPDDTDVKINAELELARKGIVHEGRLALLYGRARLMQGRVGEAEQAMRIAERLDPNDPDVAVLDAEVALAKGFEDKVALALTVGPPSPRKLAVLGRAQVMVGKYREAVASLDAALARRPGDATAITYRAIARAKLGDQSGAVRDLEKAAGQLGSSTPRYGLGLLAYERHDLLRARTELSRALDRNSESFRARALLGRVLRDLGKPKEALVELERAAKDAPALSQVQSALGRLYLDLGRDREARNALRKVLDASKANADDKLAYVEALVNLGQVAEAETAIKEATDAGAMASKMIRLKLVLQSWKGPKEAAVAAKGLEKERKGSAAHDPRLAIQTAHAWRRAGDYKKAGDDLRAALLGDALHANLGLGRVEMLSNDLVQAEAAYRSALAAWDKGAYGEDDRTEARVGLARVLHARKAYAEMVTTLQACLTDDPHAPEPHYWMARAHQDQGEHDKARGQAEKASELDDTYADAFLLLGDLTKSSNKEKAKTAYKKYLELQPDSPQAKTIKKFLGTK